MAESAAAIEREITKLEMELEKTKKKMAPKTPAELLQIAELEFNSAEHAHSVVQQRIGRIDRTLNANILAQDPASQLRGQRKQLERSLRTAEKELDNKRSAFQRMWLKIAENPIYSEAVTKLREIRMQALNAICKSWVVPLSEMRAAIHKVEEIAAAEREHVST
jgi:hypothetical protein